MSKIRGSVCYRLGLRGHLFWDTKGPAKGQTCRKCKGKDHWASVCRTKQKKTEVTQVQEEQASGHQINYTFRVTSGVDSNVLTVSVGGVNLEMLEDSGASNNIIDEEAWQNLRPGR